jgi:nitroreductase
MQTDSPNLDRPTLNRCVELATLAPSLHNSQPWRFRITGDVVEIQADPRRRLDAIDPVGREMTISLGAALFTLRLAIRRQGRIPVARVLPDPDRPDLVARVTVGRPAPVTAELTALAAAVPRRHTNRWPFVAAVVPADAIEELTVAAGLEDAVLAVAGSVGRTAILGLAREAEHRLRARGDYRAEIGRWTGPAAPRHAGVPRSAVGPWDALERMPMRDFGLTLPGVVHRAEQFEAYPTIVVLSTAGDTARQWVAAGQALQRVLLVATRRGIAATPISQPLEVPAIRRTLAGGDGSTWPQMILRMGYGPPAAATPRRPLAEVLLR